MPCWWGIVPGKTTFQEFLSNPLIDYGRSDFHVPESNGPRDYYLHYSTTEQDGVIESIDVRGGFGYGDIVMSERAMREWQRYSLAQVLTDYGVPSRVWLFPGPAVEPGFPPGYGLTVSYDPLGFSIYYGGPAKFSADPNTPELWACPVPKRVSFIRMLLRPAGSISDTETVWPEGGLLPGYSLQEGTGMSLEEFQRMFREENDQNCLRLPLKLP